MVSKRDEKMIADRSKILLVDDEEGIRRNMKAMLEDSGHQVVTAADGVEALQIFSAGPASFTLIISDMSMPAMTGLQLIKECRKHRPDILAIISSGYSTEVNEDNAHKLGINGYITKPASLKAIVATVKSVL